MGRTVGIGIQDFEQIVFNQLGKRGNAIWSLLLASGYLKVKDCRLDPVRRRNIYELSLTNFEVQIMFEEMIEGGVQNIGQPIFKKME